MTHSKSTGAVWLSMILSLACGQAIAAPVNAPPPTAGFFVAPGGQDTHPGSAEAPFATLTRAMAAVRHQRSAMPSAPIRVTLRGGVYSLKEPLRFTPADSGSPEAPVLYTAAPGERVVLSGGVPLTGTWTPTPGKPYWQLTVPAAANRQWVFHSLFVNGQSRSRARTSHHGKLELRGLGAEPGGDPRQSLCYRPGDFNPAWTNPTDIDLVLLQSWTPTIHRITEVIAEKHSLRFKSSHSRQVDAFEHFPRYYLSNVLEALDEPGEWYLNCQSGVLYYYPMAGEDLRTAEVIAPVLKTRLIEFAGDLAADRPVEYLQFQDLHFLHTDGDLDRHNGAYRQGHMFLGAALTARGLRHASFEGCEFAQLGEYAIELADGCREVTVRQCHLWDLGAGAMQLGLLDLGTLQTPPTPGAKPVVGIDSRREVLKLVIDNNAIHRLGTIWSGCYGIVNRFASLTQITHNDIFDIPWDAIGLDARWTWKGEKYSHGNEVAYNHLHHLGQRYQSDAGAIYQFGPLDTHIHHNLIHDTYAYPFNCGYAGIYLDETSRGARVENNLVYNVDWAAFYQNFGDENIIRNNIGAFARDGFFKRGGLRVEHPNNFVDVTGNLYIAQDGLGILQDWKDGPKPTQLHANRYYNLKSETPLSFGGRSFEQWQASGRDADSSVGDPGCQDPANFDFRLKPDAAVCKAIGFVPFDEQIAQAGLYGDEAWRKVLKAYGRRKVAAVLSQEEFSRLNAFTIDPNQKRVGEELPILRMMPEKYAGIHITREVAGLNGPQCIKCTDQKGLEKSYYPSLTFSPRFLRHGRIRFSLAVQQPAQGAAALNLEMRSAGKQSHVGPRLTLAADGVLRAGKQEIGHLKPGAWTRLELQFELGEPSGADYTLIVRDAEGEKLHHLPLSDPAFHDLAWIGLTMPNDAPGVCYLDAIGLDIDE